MLLLVDQFVGAMHQRRNTCFILRIAIRLSQVFNELYHFLGSMEWGESPCASVADCSTRTGPSACNSIGGSGMCQPGGGPGGDDMDIGPGDMDMDIMDIGGK